MHRRMKIPKSDEASIRIGFAESGSGNGAGISDVEREPKLGFVVNDIYVIPIFKLGKTDHLATNRR